jgi:hypothetical protein
MPRVVQVVSDIYSLQRYSIEIHTCLGEEDEHPYRVTIRLVNPDGDDGDLVHDIDYKVLQDQLKEIIGEIDEHVAILERSRGTK